MGPSGELPEATAAAINECYSNVFDMLYVVYTGAEARVEGIAAPVCECLSCFPGAFCCLVDWPLLCVAGTAESRETEFHTLLHKLLEFDDALFHNKLYTWMLEKIGGKMVRTLCHLRFASLC